MASDNRSKLSFVIALTIILGSAWIGWWRGQRQDSQVLASGALLAPRESPLETELDVEEPEPSVDPDSIEPIDAEVSVEDSPPLDVSAEELARLIEAMRLELGEGRLLEPIDSGAFA